MPNKKLTKKEIEEKFTEMLLELRSKPEPPTDADVAKLCEFIEKNVKKELSKIEWFRLILKVYWKALKSTSKFRK